MLLHLFEQSPELLQSDLTISISVKLGHQLLQLLLAHASTQLAQLTRINRTRVVFVNSLDNINDINTYQVKLDFV